MNDQLLQLLTSSLFLSGAVAELVGMFTSKKFGRRFTMICAGAAFIIGEWGATWATSIVHLPA
jgi:hypothetical protein